MHTKTGADSELAIVDERVYSPKSLKPTKWKNQKFEATEGSPA